MKIKSRNFPHPVLHPTADDIINSHFTGEITNHEVKGSLLEFSLQFKVKNETLNNLLQNGRTHLNVHFECISTMQRVSFKLQSADCEVKTNGSEVTYTSKISVESNLLNKKVDVNYFILTNEDIADYKNSKMHSDFAGVTFNLEKGDILALAITQTLHLEKEQLLKTSSIFKISRGSDTVAPFTIAMNNNQIEIIFPKNIHSKIGHFNKIYEENANKVLIQMVYYPALLDVLHNIQTLATEELQEYEALDWYTTLEKKFHSIGKDIKQLSSDTLTTLAYTILYEDINAPWASLENILIREESEEYDDIDA